MTSNKGEGTTWSHFDKLREKRGGGKGRRRDEVEIRISNKTVGPMQGSADYQVDEIPKEANTASYRS